VKSSFEMPTLAGARARIWIARPASPADRSKTTTVTTTLLTMADKLFEALKLGKKIPDSDVFLFQGSFHPIKSPD
jgi:hypothetical protein